MAAGQTTAGSAARWGPLWGAHGEDWACLEERQRPTYQAALDGVGIAPGQRVVDIGCGAGTFLRMAADLGAQVTGLDASEVLVEIARRRVPDAEVHVGEMEDLPFPDGSFDLVTGFNAFFFAADLLGALREAGRVARAGAPVLVQVWGRPEHNDLEAMKAVARPSAPAPPPGASAPPPPLWQPGVLEDLARLAGLTARTAFDVRYPFSFPDADTLGRELMSPMGLAALAGPARQAAIRAEIVQALSRYRTADGVFTLNSEFRVLIASR